MTAPSLPEGPTPSSPFSRNVQLLRLLGLAIVIGILGALAVLSFHQLLSMLELTLYGSSQGLVADATRLPLTVRILVPAAGGLVAGLILEVPVVAAADRVEQRPNG